MQLVLLQGPWRRARTGTDHLKPETLNHKHTNCSKGLFSEPEWFLRFLRCLLLYLLWLVVYVYKKPLKLASLRFLRDKDLIRLLFSFLSSTLSLCVNCVCLLFATAIFSAIFRVFYFWNSSCFCTIAEP